MRNITMILIFTMLFSMLTPVFSQEQTVVDPAKYKRYAGLNSLGLFFMTMGTGCGFASIALGYKAGHEKEPEESINPFSGIEEAITASIVIPTGASFLIAGTILFVKSKVEMNKIKKLQLSTGINEIRLVYDF